MKKHKQSRFLTELGAKDVDLRHKYKCGRCGDDITSKNWAMNSSKWILGKGFSEPIAYCRSCYLKVDEPLTNYEKEMMH